MKRKKLFNRLAVLTLAIALVFSGYSIANNGPIAVIVNKDNPVQSLSENSVKKIYTNNVLRWPNGAPINIFDLAINDPLRESFSEKVLGRSSRSIAENWAHLKITNQAKNPPHTLKTQLHILKKVSQDKSAIGYVSLSAAAENPDVKIVTTLK